MAHASESSSLETKKARKSRCDDAVGSMDRLSTISSNSPPKPPDGGWGYFVVLASFLIHIITDGVTYSFGVFYLELLYYFEEGKGKTAWIASILVGVTLCSGPISGSLVNKYGCRAVTIAGSILGSACLLASVWAPNIVTLYFTVGIGTGLGFGLIYLPAIVSVTCYFEKYRSLATGIAVCGSGLGTLVFAPFLEYLIASYGWRGTMMICAGIVLNCIVFGALFRPLEPKSSETNDATEETKMTRLSNAKRPSIRRQELSDYAANIEYVTQYQAVGFRNGTTEPGGIRAALSQPILITKIDSVHHEPIAKSFGSSGVMSRRDVLYQGSLESIRNHSGSLVLRQSEEMVRLQTSLRNIPNKPTSNGADVETKEHVEEEKDVFREMLDFSLLKDPVFLLFTLSNFCTSIGFNIPYVYVLNSMMLLCFFDIFTRASKGTILTTSLRGPEYKAQAEERGIDKAVASYLLAVIGIANTVGRIILGYISDKPWINRLLIYNLCLTICGISTAFSTFCVSFLSFTFYCVVYGFTAGAYVGLTSVILVDLLGLNRLTNAFGLLLLFQGFASLLGPPIAGWLYDALLSYDPGFYTAGCMIAISGLMLFFIPSVQRMVERKENREKCKSSMMYTEPA